MGGNVDGEKNARGGRVVVAQGGVGKNMGVGRRKPSNASE